MDRKRFVFGLLAVGVIGAAVAAFAVVREPAYSPSAMTGYALTPNIEFVPVKLSIRRGDNLEDLLARAGADRATRVGMIEAVRDAFDVKKFKAGSEITLTRTSAGRLSSLEYVIDPDSKLRVSQTDETYSAVVEEIPGTIITAPVCGSIDGNLFTSIERLGEKPEILAIRMAEIFAWDIDFYTDPQPGDEFCLLVEKKVYVNGQDPTYRRILSAKYVNTGTPYGAYLYPDKDGKEQYYSGDGKSLQSAFLRSPMKFEARVSSHFSHRRLHPVLKIHRPHLGTDYAAPRGTPVQAVASGQVTFSGYSGGSGNLVKIKHANGFETMYMHLSKRYVKRGQKVEQGRRIGAVGSTGLSTGAHLDFRIRKNGKYLNPEKLKPPRSSQIPPDQIATFNAGRDRFSAMMEPVYGPPMIRAD